MAAQIVSGGDSIVLRGSFNPAIFHPEWFAARELISREAADAAQVVLISTQFSNYTTEQFALQVTHDLFSLSTTAMGFPEVARDLAVGTFRILQFTPLAKLGINHYVHVATGSEEAWHSIGHRLAPKDEIWSPILERPGTITLTVQGTRPDECTGYINVKIEPSVQVRYGVFIEVNDHYELPAGQESTDASVFVGILESLWPESVERSRRIVEHLRGMI